MDAWGARARQEIKFELEFLLSTPQGVWGVLDHAVGVPAVRLRSGVVSAALTTSAYVRERVELAKALPWSLLAKLAEAALEELV